MKRKLDKQELAISIKSLDRLREELEYNKYQEEICDLKLNKGLKIEHMKQIRDYKTLKKEYAGKVEYSQAQIKIIEDQIRNGVEVKEKKEKINEKEDKE